MGKARKYELTERQLHVLIAVASFLVAEEKFRSDDVMSNQCSAIAAGIAMKITAHLSGEEPMDENELNYCRTAMEEAWGSEEEE